jgi:glycosyltransferase involved in cell wall biosynthesis
MTPSPRNLGFISTRFAGTDGVSLETEKWAQILTDMGHDCFYFSGECDRPEDRVMVIPEAHFTHPDIVRINEDLFDDYQRSSETTGRIQAFRFHLKQHLYQFIETFDIDVIIVENALSIPMNIPLGLALTELIAETHIPTIAHHHDFSWERSRYAVTAAGDYLRAAFPPTLPSIRHVVINSFAARQMALRTGESSTLIPNVMDFDNPPPPKDAYTSQLREALGIKPDQTFLLQPTRIVPRKRIELAIELAHRVNSDAVLVITHKSGDEGSAYEQRLKDYAQILGVKVIFGSDKVNHYRGEFADGKPIFSLADAYQEADLVTYPSTIEGFGNAFLETLYYQKPIVISTYEIFKTDIQPKGFEVIGFDDFIEESTVRQAKEILNNPAEAARIVAHNYALGLYHYSFNNLKQKLSSVLYDTLGT